jgi:hypothetical protein
MDELMRSRGWESRRGLYIWLGRKLGIPDEEIKDRCHVAMFDIEQCARVVAICSAALVRDQEAGR